MDEQMKEGDANMNEMPFPVIDCEKTGKNILRLRKLRGLTVKQVQQYFGFEEPRAIYKWQSGQCLPSVDNLYALSVLFQVNMEEILVGSKMPQAEPAAVYFHASLGGSVHCSWRRSHRKNRAITLPAMPSTRKKSAAPVPFSLPSRAVKAKPLAMKGSNT